MCQAVRNQLANVWLLASIGVVAVGASIWVSHCSCKWHWFGRSGAIMTMVGVLLSVRPMVRMSLSDYIKSQSVIDCGNIESTQEDSEKDLQAKEDATAAWKGAIMAFIGTLIWAYGDLIGGLP